MNNVEPRYLIILSRAHAEDLFPQAGSVWLARIGHRIETSGAVIIEIDQHGMTRLRVAENGVQVANRLVRS